MDAARGPWKSIDRSSATPAGRLGSSAEDSPSGLWRTLGKRVGFTPSGVRIPYPPQVGRGVLLEHTPSAVFGAASPDGNDLPADGAPADDQAVHIVLGRRDQCTARHVGP